MTSIINDLAVFFLDELTATPGTLNEYGEFVPSGTVLNLPCRIEGEQRLVRDPSGHEVTTSVIAIIGGYYDLTTDLHRYVLPARYKPNGTENGQGLRAVYIDKVGDDESPEAYVEVGF